MLTALPIQAWGSTGSVDGRTRQPAWRSRGVPTQPTLAPLDQTADTAHLSVKLCGEWRNSWWSQARTNTCRGDIESRRVSVTRFLEQKRVLCTETARWPCRVRLSETSAHHRSLARWHVRRPCQVRRRRMSAAPSERATDGGLPSPTAAGRASCSGGGVGGHVLSLPPTPKGASGTARAIQMPDAAKCLHALPRSSASGYGGSAPSGCRNRGRARGAIRQQRALLSCLSH